METAAAAAADNPIASLQILPALARATLEHSVVASLCFLEYVILLIIYKAEKISLYMVARMLQAI